MSRRGVLLVVSALIAVVSLADQGSCQNDYLDDYFDKVVASFYEKLVQIGISSLPVKDVTLAINRTLNPDDLHLEGNVSYTGGAVVEIEELFKIRDGHRGDPEDNSAHLFYQIDFPNMTVVADISAHTTLLGSGQGIAEIFFPNSTIGVTLDVDYATGKKSVSLETYSTPGPWTNFQPATELMDGLARLGRLELGSRMLWDQLDLWCAGVFYTTLNTVVQEINFPIIPPIREFDENWEWKDHKTIDRTTEEPGEDPENVYVRKIASLVDVEVQEKGLELQLRDVQYFLNRTLLGVPLYGHVSIRRGFIPSFGNVVRTAISPSVVPGDNPDTATISNGISVTNITLLYDLEVQIDTGLQTGTVEITLPIVDFIFQMTHTFSTGVNKAVPDRVFMNEVEYLFQPWTQAIQAVRMAVLDQVGPELWLQNDFDSWNSGVACPVIEQVSKGLEFPVKP